MASQRQFFGELRESQDSDGSCSAGDYVSTGLGIHRFQARRPVRKLFASSQRHFWVMNCFAAAPSRRNGDFALNVDA